MKYFVYVYLLLYICYVLFGPHYIMRTLRQDKLNIAENIQEIFRRMLFLSYIAYLYNAYYFYNPNSESLINALIINFLAFFIFIIKWYNLRNDDPYYYTGIVMHMLVILPLLVSIFYYKINYNKLTFGIQSKFTLLLLISYFLIESNIYSSGYNLKEILLNKLNL